MPTAKPRPPLAPGETRAYPVLPLRDIVVFPHMIVPLFVGREKSIKALEEVMRSDTFILPRRSQVEPTTGQFTGIDSTAVTYKLPDQFKWRDPLGNSPINQTTLHGDPSKPGLYVVINRYKPGAFSRPHFHPNTGFVTVLKGTLWVGTGTKFDPNNTVAMPTGTFMTHFGKQVHFQGAKDNEEVMILVAGEGPATSTPAEEK
jgi:quercetin dioxygenase-like cupin family protein